MEVISDHVINQNEQPSQQRCPSSNDQENKRRRSITQIIKSGSYQNINQNIRHFSVSSILNKNKHLHLPSQSMQQPLLHIHH